VVEGNAPRIVEDYLRRLREAGSPLVVDLNMRRQLTAQARRVLDETARSLRGLSPSRQGPEEDRLSEAIGQTRAANGVHPSESLRAVATLSEATLAAVAENLPPSPTSRTELAEVASAIQKSVTERVMRASVSYAEYLLSEVHEAHRDERLRIARRLRNEAAHDLAVVCQNLELHDLLKEHDPGRAAAKLQLALRTAHEALREVKGFSEELQETAVGSRGLEAALSDLLGTVVPSGVQSWLSVEGDASLLPPHAREELFLILREAVRLASGRPGTRQVRLAVRVGSTRLHGLVEDDGAEAHLEEGTVLSEVAIGHIRERATLMGGSVGERRRAGGGNRTEVILPLAPRGKVRPTGGARVGSEAHPAPLRVLLADAHSLFRQSTREVLTADPRSVEVVGEAASAADAVALARERRPDAVLLDLEVPPVGAREAIADLAAASPSSKVMVLGMCEDPDLAGGLLAAGASGYAVKDAAREDLLSAIHAAVAGGSGVVLSVPRGRPGGEGSATPGVRLSERQLEVVRLAARRMTNAQIASSLHISEKTVKRHLANVYSELGVGSRGEAVEKLRAEGLLGG
jgi:DNA-binding NarL/FixJ family response regulator/signal transduction histidine kinase